jgi:ferritin-like metal-binding protein YciE
VDLPSSLPSRILQDEFNAIKNTQMTHDIQKITTLPDILDYNVRKIASAESQLKSILPNWVNAASSLTLKNALNKYLRLVEHHNQKLHDFLNEEKIDHLNGVNIVMQGFVKEAIEKINNCGDTEGRDASLLESIRAINRYKLNMYGTAAAFSKTLGKSAMFFREAELHEREINNKLSQLAQHKIHNKLKAPAKLSGKPG